MMASCRALGLTLLEAATGRYPYDASGGPLELMLQVQDALFSHHSDASNQAPLYCAHAASSYLSLHDGCSWLKRCVYDLQ